jgi:hypothetical protein
MISTEEKYYSLITGHSQERAFFRLNNFPENIHSKPKIGRYKKY